MNHTCIHTLMSTHMQGLLTPEKEEEDKEERIVVINAMCPWHTQNDKCKSDSTFLKTSVNVGICSKFKTKMDRRKPRNTTDWIIRYKNVDVGISISGLFHCSESSDCLCGTVASLDACVLNLHIPGSGSAGDLSLLQFLKFELKCALPSSYTATSATAASILISVTSKLSSSSSPSLSSSTTVGTQGEGRHVAWLLLLLAALISGLPPAPARAGEMLPRLVGTLVLPQEWIRRARLAERTTEDVVTVPTPWTFPSRK